MSDNSYILLAKTPTGYSVSHRDADDEGEYTYSQKDYKNLVRALRGAQRLQNERMPEYNVRLEI